MAIRDELVEAFEAWVLDPARGDVVDVSTHLPAGRLVTDQWPVAAVAYELADEMRQLSDRAGTVMRLPGTATWAHAARMLWTLRNDADDPAGDHADALRMLQVLDAVAFARLWRRVDAEVARLRRPADRGDATAA